MFSYVKLTYIISGSICSLGIISKGHTLTEHYRRQQLKLPVLSAVVATGSFCSWHKKKETKLQKILWNELVFTCHLIINIHMWLWFKIFSIFFLPFVLKIYKFLFHSNSNISLIWDVMRLFKLKSFSRSIKYKIRSLFISRVYD